ncbi:hypothetical protein HMPREF0765_2081 [Sphingobacterium spiritivorum ATCC 33300]|uniref:Uncharacterized protein n=1 Tax=Sphingobacterium spiritivorum ATCC 33300 TaxID=525372 RepID=C2FXM5_SPHSI|nr:hypothetical protein [Sphingobacterium spiritivorum]EEI92466.1 hypothetical protein HMPREF0765_2081 [Sphingobacterium spiritivorum ATCC 33300]QQS96794.1 hypothetical protein I6J03_03500 [Sphingobacterium spiritivorum]
MKKISLKSIKTEELLSRDELKQIMGGFSDNGGSGSKCNCNTSADCNSSKDGKVCRNCNGPSGGYYGYCTQ